MTVRKDSRVTGKGFPTSGSSPGLTERFPDRPVSFLAHLGFPFLAYQETWRRGLYKVHPGIPNFRVLTLTTDRERVEHLVAAYRSLSGGARLFLFTDRGLGSGTSWRTSG